MVEGTKTEGAAARYNGYIAELREFFASRSVRFGRPEDVVPFAALVAEPGPFAEEMGSMLRSFLYYEDERLSREDLLMLTTLAVGQTPLQPEMPGLDDALRQLFRFVNGALRQRGSVIPSEREEETGDRGNDPAGAEGTPAHEGDLPQEWAMPLPEPLRGPQPAPTVEAAFRRDAGGESVLLRAVTMSAQAEEAAGTTSTPGAHLTEQRPADPASALVNTPRRSRGKIWLLPAGAFAAAAGVLLYLLWPTMTRRIAAPDRAARGGLHTAATAGAPAAARTCVPPGSAAMSRAALEERSFMAHNLLDQQMYAAALQQLHAIAEADPGFPGVYLDESDALLQVKQPERAREAIDAQIRISECLGALPSASLDAYCATHFSSSTIGACRPQLAHIRQAAELQAALVHLELGHRVEADDGAAAALKQLQQDDADEISRTKPARPAPKRAASFRGGRN